MRSVRYTRVPCLGQQITITPDSCRNRRRTVFVVYIQPPRDLGHGQAMFVHVNVFVHDGLPCCSTRLITRGAAVDDSRCQIARRLMVTSSAHAWHDVMLGARFIRVSRLRQDSIERRGERPRCGGPAPKVKARRKRRGRSPLTCDPGLDPHERQTTLPRDDECRPSVAATRALENI